jgi:hypothetical protein
MNERLVFSRQKLRTYLTCQRRFQLRYLRHLSWPVAPQEAQWRDAAKRGQAFHQLLERHFLGLAVDPGRDAQINRWWETFSQSGPDIPPGVRLPEINITVPIGNHLLTGRFDLLVLNGPAGHIFDWKTEQHPRSTADLVADWQTRLYLAILAEGGAALLPGSQAFDPDLIKLTYWFVQAPQHTATLTYSRAQHEVNWAEIKLLVTEIGEKPASEAPWPLTDNWSACGRCAYQVFCGRQAAPQGDDLLDWTEGEEPWRLELERF